MDHLGLLLPLLLGLLLAVALAAWAWERGRLARRGRRRRRVALRGESEAELLLDAAGYAILERQATGRWTLWVDEREVEVACRADLLVERDGALFVAEVKTGALAPDPCRPATRRQLLEYQVAFEADGLLLVDMAERRIRQVRLPLAIGPPA